MRERSEVSRWIVAGRERLGMAQDAFAERLGYSRKTICNWETGFSKPDRYATQDLITLIGPPEEAHDGQE